MDGLHKRRIALAGGAAALLALTAIPGPLAEIQFSRVNTDAVVNRLEASFNIGIFAVSFLHVWTSRSRN